VQLQGQVAVVVALRVLPQVAQALVEQAVVVMAQLPPTRQLQELQILVVAVAVHPQLELTHSHQVRAVQELLF
jgi:hypothetical protein